MDISNSIFSDEALKGRRILVTGASSGIGAHAAKLFSCLGAHPGVTGPVLLPCRAGTDQKPCLL